MAGQRRTPIERAIAATHGNDRQSRYLGKRQAAGLVRVAVWIPTERADEMKALARKMVADHLGMTAE